MPLTSRTRIKIWLVLVVVFALGCATGAALDVLYHARARTNRGDGRGPRGDMEARFDTMRRDLGLTDEQASAIRTILEETRNEYRTLRTELRPRFEEPRQKARARIRALLTPEQRQKFDAIVAQQDSRREEEDSRHGRDK
jgi:Spy/CpxP family protein refolding chaperone